MVFAVLVAGLTITASASAPPPPGPPCTDCPNIVFLLTDDQDLILGGWDPMNQTKRIIQPEGAFSTDFYIHTPICAPSRAQLASGRYFRNIWSSETTPSPAVSSGGVAQVNLTLAWPYHIGKLLREQAGYVSGMFGKCMNGDCGRNPSAGNKNLHLMGAFDRWFEHAGYVNGTFFDNEARECKWPWVDETKCSTRTFPGGVWAGKGDGYDTATIGNKSVEWIKQVAGGSRPFFLYLAPHAPHSPATPAPWYAEGTFCDNVRAPRVPNYNYSGHPITSKSAQPPSGPAPMPTRPVWWWNSTEFHELVSSQPPFDETDVEAIDALASARCKALLSVDDAWVAVYETIRDLGQLNNTYFLITSDHGYNLGNHMLPSNKFLPFEHSLKIPMVFAGPGIKKGSKFDFLGTQVDLAPTMLGLAGVDTPEIMDGESLVPLLVKDTETAPGATSRHLQTAPVPQRSAAFHTYCSQGDWMETTRHVLDDWSNTYIGVTYRGPHGHYRYTYVDPYLKQSLGSTSNMKMLFDLEKDPYELHNIYNQTLTSNPSLIHELNATTFQYFNCQGPSCRSIH